MLVFGNDEFMLPTPVAIGGIRVDSDLQTTTDVLPTTCEQTAEIP
jgi:hypothetical protein